MRRAFIIILLMGLTSCASIINGTTAEVPFKTNPTNAKVEVSGQSCFTPCVLKLPRGRYYEVKISKEGYEPKIFPLNGQNLDPWVFGNIAIGGLIGLAIDFSTNGAYKFSPDNIDAQLIEGPHRPKVDRKIASEK